MIAGREFTRCRLVVSQHVAIVNEAFAKKFNLGQNVVGTRMELGRNDKPEFDIEIVGLVQDAKYSEVKQDIPPQFFLPPLQRDTRGVTNFYVRSSLETNEINRAISRIVSSMDANLPIENLRSMEEQVRERSKDDVLLARDLEWICGARDAARRGGTLRSARLLCGTAHTGNRCSPRAWGRRAGHSPHGASPRRRN